MYDVPSDIRLIRWELFWNLILQFDGYLPTVYNAVPSRSRCDRNNACFGTFLKNPKLELQLDKTVTSLHHCEMADSLDGA